MYPGILKAHDSGVVAVELSRVSGGVPHLNYHDWW